MGIINITSISGIECQTSKKATKNLVDKIKNQKDESSANLGNSSNQQEKFKALDEFYDDFVKNLQITPAQLKANNMATSHSVSIWLSSLPLKNEKF